MAFSYGVGWRNDAPGLLTALCQERLIKKIVALVLRDSIDFCYRRLHVATIDQQSPPSSFFFDPFGCGGILLLLHVKQRVEPLFRVLPVGDQELGSLIEPTASHQRQLVADLLHYHIEPPHQGGCVSQSTRCFGRLFDCRSRSAARKQDSYSVTAEKFAAWSCSQNSINWKR
jgi:hypothetical protein